MIAASLLLSVAGFIPMWHVQLFLHYLSGKGDVGVPAPQNPLVLQDIRNECTNSLNQAPYLGDGEMWNYASEYNRLPASKVMKGWKYASAYEDTEGEYQHRTLSGWEFAYSLGNFRCEDHGEYYLVLDKYKFDAKWDACEIGPLDFLWDKGKPFDIRFKVYK